MRKYVYDNAIVYITEPTEEQKENIRKSTERFAQTLAKKGLLNNEQRRHHSRTNGASINARKRASNIIRKNQST